LEVGLRLSPLLCPVTFNTDRLPGKLSCRHRQGAH